MRYGLKEGVLKKIRKVFETFPAVEEAVLYGSRANGTQRPGSDIDLTLKGHGLNLELMNEIGLQLDDLLLPYTFDLSIYHQINDPDLIAHILRVGVLFYSKNK